MVSLCVLKVSLADISLPLKVGWFWRCYWQVFAFDCVYHVSFRLILPVAISDALLFLDQPMSRYMYSVADVAYFQAVLISTCWLFCCYCYVLIMCSLNVWFLSSVSRFLHDKLFGQSGDDRWIFCDFSLAAVRSAFSSNGITWPILKLDWWVQTQGINTN